MDRVPPELIALVWKARFRCGDALAIARCPVYTKVWRDARLCCKQAAAAGKFIALLFAPNDVFMRSLDLKAKLTLPTRAEQIAAMSEVQEINGKRLKALMTGPFVNESRRDKIMRQRLKIELKMETRKALCFELNQTLDRPWKDEDLALIVVGFAHFNAWRRTASELKSTLGEYMRSYEEMVTQAEERERDMKQRLDAGESVGGDWISAALNCGRGINALREAGEL